MNYHNKKVQPKAIKNFNKFLTNSETDFLTQFAKEKEKLNLPKWLKIGVNFRSKTTGVRCKIKSINENAGTLIVTAFRFNKGSHNELDFSYTFAAMQKNIDKGDLVPM